MPRGSIGGWCTENQYRYRRRVREVEREELDRWLLLAAVREVMPPGRAWKKLWEAQRVHMVEFPSREGLPKGLRVVNVYAPITAWSGEREDIERVWFQELLIEAITALDLSIPTMFVGDWNGTMRPERDWKDWVGTEGLSPDDEASGSGWAVGGLGGCIPGLVGLDVSEGRCPRGVMRCW